MNETVERLESSLHCPECKGEPIGVNVRGMYDGILFWKCQECGKAWQRFGQDDFGALLLRNRAQPFIDVINA